MSKSKRSWKLLRPSRDGQRVWQDTFTGDLYVADHSGDWGRNSENVGTPDKTDDGPLRIVKRGTTDTVNMTASDGCWFVSVRAERDQRNGTVLLDFPCALFIAGQLGVVPTILLQTGGGIRSFRVEAA